MPKISKEESQKRKDFVRKLWEKEPDLSVAKINLKVKEEFGGMMNNQQLYNLRNEIRGVKKKGKVTSTVSANREEATRVVDMGKAVVEIESEKEGEVLQKALDRLKHQGFIDCRVVEYTSSHAIISRL